MGKKARTRSPAYPYLDLRAALEKAGTLWRAEGRHAVAVSLAMQHWGYKAESSTGYSCVAALKKFGLVDEEGVGDSRQVKLSRLALTVLLDEDRASPERNAALQTAALSPRIHAELWEKYGAELPSDSSLRRFLIIEKNFNEAAVDEFLEEYKTTVAFAGLKPADPASALPSEEARVASRGNAGTGGSPKLADTRQSSMATLRQSAAAASRRATSAGAAEVLHKKFVSAPAPTPPAVAGSPARKRGSLAPHAPAAAKADAETGFLFPEVNAGKTAPPPAGSATAARAKSTAASPTPAVNDDPTWPAELAQQRELVVPLDNDLVVRVPYPMSEDDFDLLIETLHLWKRRLVPTRG